VVLVAAFLRNKNVFVSEIEIFKYGFALCIALSIDLFFYSKLAAQLRKYSIHSSFGDIFMLDTGNRIVRMHDGELRMRILMLRLHEIF